MSKEKNNIFFRTKIVFAILIVVTLAITVRLVVLKISQPLKDTKSMKVVVPERGSIYSADNEILAISLNRYNVLINFKKLFNIVEGKSSCKSEKEFEIIISDVFNELMKIFPEAKYKSLKQKLNKEKDKINKERDNGFEITQNASAYDKNKWTMFLESLPDSIESDRKAKRIIENAIIFKDFKEIATTYFDISINFDALFKEKDNFLDDKDFENTTINLIRSLDNAFLQNKKEKSLTNYFLEQKTKSKKNEAYLVKEKISATEITKWRASLKNKKLNSLSEKSILIKAKRYNDALYMRKNPFKNLAIRTIGKLNDSISEIPNPQYKELFDNGDISIIEHENINPYYYQKTQKGAFGLERFYNNILAEKIGIGLHKKLENGVWTLLDFGAKEKSNRGKDIYSSINITYQNFVDSELKRKLYETEAEWGTAILMEVNTGKIRAIANLGRRKLKDTVLYEEDYNYAAGNVKNSDFPASKVPRPEPGSTFKLASLLVVLEDYNIDINDTIDCENGKATITIGESKIDVTDPTKHGKMTISEIFEKSSNIGFAKLIDEYYQKNPKKFYKGLHKLYLDTLLGVSIPGEFKAKTVTDEVAYVKLSHGYGWEVSPLQILTLYNAVANNGEMIKPLFIDSIKSENAKTEIFQKEVLNPSICSQKTLKILQKLLVNAVENGTGTKVKNKAYSVAGKTGTAQINYNEVKNDNTKDLKHFGSFVGYFPADNPKYTLFVGIYKTGKGKPYYGGDVAAPVFGNIADKIYSINPKFYTKNNENSTNVFPNCEKGNLFEINKILCYLGFPSQENKITYKWGEIFEKENEIQTKITKLNDESLVPNVCNMSLRDAIEILEERNLKVNIIGTGHVIKQSIKENTKIKNGQTITLTLKN